MKFYLQLAGLSLLGLVGIGMTVWGYQAAYKDVPVEEVPPISSVKDEYIKCIRTEDKSVIGECLEALTERAYGMYPVSEIAAVLDTLDNKQKERWCHETMHYFGWRAYEEEPDIAQAFINSSELCDSGMYHGVIEEYLRNEGFSGNIKELIRTTCTDSLEGRPDISQGHIGLCYHGLGHGLMFITSSDLRRSLELCDELGKDERGVCYSGAFMEFTASKAAGPLGNQRDWADYSHCETLNEEHLWMCYHRQGINNLAAANGDVKKAMEMCQELPEEYWNGCYFGVGGNNPAPNIPHADAGKACNAALAVSEDAYLNCLDGSLGFVMQIEWGDMQGAIDFCSATDSSYMERCYAFAGKAVTSWLKDSETIEDKCAAFPTEDAQAACLRGVTGDQREQTR